MIIRDEKSKSWLQFEYPEKVYKTNKIEEVISILQKVEDQVAKGYYAAGFLSYEAASAFDSALKTKQTDAFPLIWFGIFQQVKEVNPTKFITSSDQAIDWIMSVGQEEYFSVFQKIKDYLQKGDTYQVNYTLRKEAVFEDDPWKLFQGMIDQASFGAFIDLKDYSICSASPELFFRCDNGKLVSRPMKGTIQRGRTLEEDKQYQQQLFNSQKDRSENIMIVDMIRNDLGRIAETGSVKVPRLFETEKYPTVWQMTSTVEASTNKSLVDIFSALFPCASITGAPKASAMKIIKEIEQSNRKIYTGSIGFITPQKNMQFNVAIRTALVDKKKKLIEYGAGGGIVWASDPQKEYQECLLKTKILNTPCDPDFDLLETLLWQPDEEDYFLLSEHLERLKKTAEYFDYSLDIDQVKKELQNIQSNFESHPHKVRLLVSKNGKIKTEHKKLFSKSDKTNRAVCLAEYPVDEQNKFLFHKTTNRTIYRSYLIEHPNVYDVLLWNKKGELTESCNANLVVKWNGKLLTPPVQCGLLGGTFRHHLLQRNIISEAILPVENLSDFEEIYLINSVRKWQPVKLMTVVWSYS